MRDDDAVVPVIASFVALALALALSLESEAVRAEEPASPEGPTSEATASPADSTPADAPAPASAPAPMVAPAPPAAPPAPAAPAPGTAGTAPEKCSIAVLDLEVGEGVPKERAASWTDVVVQEMQGHSGCTVLSRADIRSVISLEAEKSLLGCDQQSCLAELGGALGVSHLVTGRISRIEGNVLLSLRKTNLKTMTVEARATDGFDGQDDEVFAFVAWLSKKLVLADDKEIGPKPVPKPRPKAAPQLVERRSTLWRTLFWTSGALTVVSAAVFGGAAGTAAFLSDQTKAAKLSPKNNADFIATADSAGPIAASVANASLYAGGAFALAGVVFFFFPADELARVDVGAAP